MPKLADRKQAPPRNLDDVRAHAVVEPDELGARVYAGGSDIRIGAHADDGEHFLGPEPMHVVQQPRGRAADPDDLAPPKPADIQDALGHYGE